MPLAEPSQEQFANNPLAKYIAATRPPFLLAALVGALLGIATAYNQGSELNMPLALLTLVGAVLVHAGINVLNDYYDALNGTDAANTERVFPFTGGSRFIQNGLLTPAKTLRFGVALMVLTAVIGIVLVFKVGLGLLWLGVAGLVIGWAYSAPPLALNSRGLGELCVALGFGWLIPLGAQFVQAGEYQALTLWVATPYALLTAALLYINQFPDFAADKIAGKRHWVVRMGRQRARWGYVVMVSIAYGVLLFTVIAEKASALCLLGGLSLPLSIYAGIELVRFPEQPARLVGAIKATIAAALIHGLLVSVGLWFAS